MLERALAINKRAYGRDHAEVVGTLNDLGIVLNDLAIAYGQLGNQAKLQDVMKRSFAIKERGGTAFGTQDLAITDQSDLFLATSVGSFGFGNLSVEDNWNDQSHRCWKSRSRDRPSHIGKRRSDPSSMDRFCMDRDLANLDPFVGGAVKWAVPIDVPGKWAVPIDVPGKRRDPAYLHELLVSESL